MTVIIIGRIVATGQPLRLDLDKLKHLILQASSGGGKSNAIRAILEAAHGIFPQYCLDVEGEYVTLRDHGDYVLVAGQGGDVQADTRTAGLLVRRCVEANFDVLVDLSEVDRRNQHEYVRESQETFTNLSRDLWGSRLIVIDEANLFAPESGKQKDSSVAKDATVNTAARGRKRDHKGIFAMTRLAKFSKDVAAECQDKLIGLCNLADDRKRAVEELGVAGDQRKTIEHNLAHMKPGQFYAIGPAFGLTEVTLVQIMLAKTAPPPKGKAARRAPAPRASVERILKQIGDLPAQAAVEVRNMQEATSRIRELETENRKLKAGAPAAAPRVERVVERVEVPVLGQQDRELMQTWISNIKDVGDQVNKRLDNLVDATKTPMLQAVLAKVVQGGKPPSAQSLGIPPLTLSGGSPGFRKKAAKAGLAVLPESKKPDYDFDGTVDSLRKLTGGAARMAQILAAGHPRQFTWPQLATLAGLKHVSGTTDTYKSQLRKDGWVQEAPSGLVTATGLTLLTYGGGKTQPQSPEEVRAMWLSKFTGGARRMLEVLIEAHPEAMPVSELLRRAGFSSQTGTTDTYLSALRSNGLVVTEGKGDERTIRAIDTLFEPA